MPPLAVTVVLPVVRLSAPPLILTDDGDALAFSAVPTLPDAAGTPTVSGSVGLVLPASSITRTQ